MMENTSEEESKSKACALHVRVVSGAKVEAHKKMPTVNELLG